MEETRSEARRCGADLNADQLEAAGYGIEDGRIASRIGPLLIIAGAGSGKTTTLAHRVARLVLAGADPQRILLLTFTRRAAMDMTRRCERIVARALSDAREAAAMPNLEVENGTAARGRPALPSSARLSWAGTFHSVANRLLRLHARSVGLDPSFTVLDRSDAADLLDLVRSTQELDKKATRFPRKGTCFAIYSHVLNTQRSVGETLAEAFPWCRTWEAELRALFRAYVEAKQVRNVLDYDDLLVWWNQLMTDPTLAAAVGERFDHVLVDEYQDTNALQAAILTALKPDGTGVTVVGDDAQAIYSFRGATVRNILDFPRRTEPAARIVTLAHNYRSTQPILDSANAVIAFASERFTKDLYSSRTSRQRPVLACVEDEAAQVDYVVERVLAAREAGVDLCRQAVLFRTAHHSDALEVELSRRNIPFVKFGGLKFLEAAHVKDVLCILRWAENPRDTTAGFRVLQLLRGVGPAVAMRAMQAFERGGFEVPALSSFRPPSAAAEDWPGLLALLRTLREGRTGWHGQVGTVRAWYDPFLDQLYDAAHVRRGDLEQLEQIAHGYETRERFLTELTLDPPDASGTEAGPPLLDEDYLILSTIHSAKGQEWDAVYLLNVVDGCVPSDMSTGTAEQVEEERRLLYVAMTRARDDLHLIQPLRFYIHGQHRQGDRHVYAPRTRFLPDSTLRFFERVGISTTEASHNGMTGLSSGRAGITATRPVVDVASRLRQMWK